MAAAKVLGIKTDVIVAVTAANQQKAIVNVNAMDAIATPNQKAIVAINLSFLNISILRPSKGPFSMP
jgi:hypothetical protein